MCMHTCTNKTLSQKQLEIQALRCNGETRGRCQHKRHHSILRFQLDSDVCSADLHHNPQKHVGLHAHQRLPRLPLDAIRAPAPASPPFGRSRWSSASAGSTGGRPGWALATMVMYVMYNTSTYRCIFTPAVWSKPCKL
jgi:hypothetical protein